MNGVSAHRQGFTERLGVDIQVRVGIDTGLVVIGALGAGDWTTGDSIFATESSASARSIRYYEDDWSDRSGHARLATQNAAPLLPDGAGHFRGDHSLIRLHADPVCLTGRAGDLPFRRTVGDRS